MTCGGCVIGVRKVLTRLPGVLKADVIYEKNRAVVTYDPAAVTVEQMVAAIATLGYKAIVLLLGGTAGSAWLARHLPALAVALGILFALSLWLLLRSEPGATADA